MINLTLFDRVPVIVAPAEMQCGQIASVVHADELLAARRYKVGAVLDLVHIADAFAIHSIESLLRIVEMTVLRIVGILYSYITN